MGLRSKRARRRRSRGSVLQQALDLAERDPEAFRARASELAQKVGTTVEDLYAQARRDPRAVKRLALDTVLKRGAKILKRELGW